MNLFTKTFLFMLISLIVVVFSISYLVAKEQISCVERNVIQNRTMIGSFLSKEIEVGYFESKWPFESLKKLSEYNGFLFWWIVRDDGTIHLADKAAFIGTVAKDYFPEIALMKEQVVTLRMDEKHGIFFKPLSTGKNKWSFWYGFSLDEISARKREIIVLITSISLSVFLVVSITLFIGIKHFTKPIKTLIDGASIIGGGDLTHQVKIESQDEIGNLAHSFNKMADDLLKSYTALQESEERFRFLAEKMADIVWILDRNFHTTYVSPSIEKILGFTPEERKRQSLEEMITPESLKRAQMMFLEELRRDEAGNSDPDRSVTIEVEYYRKDKSTVWMENSVKVLRDHSGAIDGIYGVSHDIAERKQAEKALRESKERYRTLIGAIPDPLVVYDPEGRVTYVNDAFERVYGWSRKELLGERIDFVPPEEAEATQEAWRRTFQDGTIFFETKRWNRNRDLLDIQLRTGILRDQEGKHALSIVIHRDVTALKQAERELRESRANLQTLFNSVDDFLFVLDIKGHIIQVNPVALKRLGYSEAELLGEHVLKVHPPDRHKEAAAIIADMVAGKTDWCPIPLLGKDGTQIPVETKVTQGRWGNQDVFFGVSRDITERIRADEELRDSESKFHSLFDLSPQAIALTEVETGKLIDVNNKFCELTKYSKKEVIGLTTTTELGFYTKEDRNRFLKDLQASSEVNGLKMDFRAKDGSTLNALMFARIISIAGRPFILTIFFDVTAQRHLEAQLQQAQKMEAIGILAGGIAHDFNNLLTVIMGNIELAEHEIKSDVGVSELLKHAGEASLQAKELIKQLITFSKGGAPIKKVGSIGDLVKETTNLVLTDTNVKCEFFLPHELWSVEFDEDQMKHAVKNLIVNAVESMPDGGSIEVRTENFAINLESAQPKSPVSGGEYVKITIRDQGIGITEEHLSMIFDPYFSTKERGTQKGMGLGLAITYSIINRHDGYVTVESEIGVGTTFTLYLPAYEKDIRELEPVKAPLPEKTAIRTGRVLLMDDEEMVRNFGKEMLLRLGFDTEHAKDGAEAIELYKRAMDLGKPYDAVILDLTVKGGMSGKDAVKRLLEIDPQVKAIISSGYSNDPVMADFKKYGFIGALPKPYTMKDLSDTLNCFS